MDHPDAGFYPLVVVGTLERDDGIELLIPGRGHVLVNRRGRALENQGEVVLALLRRCTGYESREDVLSAVCAAFPGTEPSLVERALDDLIREGAIVDSRRTLVAHHRLARNPGLYAPPWTVEQIATYKRQPRLAVVDGPAATAVSQLPTALAALQAERRSCRSFAHRPVELDALGHVLVSGYRVIMADRAARSRSCSATASAGGLYPLKIYVAIASGNELAPGYYEYDPECDGVSDQYRLVPLSAALDELQLKCAFDSDSGSLPYGAPALVVIAADLERHAGRYANRGYPYTLIEAGMALQNMLLAAGEVGVATLPFGGFLDEAIAAELHMNDGLRRRQVEPLITLAFGYRNEAGERDDSAVLLERLNAALVGPGRPIATVDTTWGLRPGVLTTFYGASVSYRRPGDAVARGSATGTAHSSSGARLCAIAEAFERLVTGIPRVDVLASAHELDARSQAWLDPRVVAPLTGEQYERLPELQRFSVDAPMQWVRGARARNDDPVLVPVDLVFNPLDTERWGRGRLAQARSCGVAAHTTLRGAFTNALVEAVERDAIMRTWFAQQTPPRIAADQLPRHWGRRVEHWRRHGRRVDVLDLSRNGVIVVQVVITSAAQPCFLCGAGASLESFEVALGKAFREAELFLESDVRPTSQQPLRPEQVSEPEHHKLFWSVADQAKRLSWLTTGPLTNGPPDAQTTLDQLARRLDPVIVQLAPLPRGTDSADLSQDLTAMINSGLLTVVRVISTELVPMTFGYGNTIHTHRTLAGQVAPASLEMPHYFP